MFGFIHALVVGPLQKLWLVGYRRVEPLDPPLPAGVGVAVGEGLVVLSVRGPGGVFAVQMRPQDMRALCHAGWEAAREAEHGPRFAAQVVEEKSA
jgi:hypothetical protein